MVLIYVCLVILQLIAFSSCRTIDIGHDSEDHQNDKIARFFLPLLGSDAHKDDLKLAVVPYNGYKSQKHIKTKPITVTRKHKNDLPVLILAKSKYIKGVNKESLEEDKPIHIDHIGLKYNRKHSKPSFWKSKERTSSEDDSHIDEYSNESSIIIHVKRNSENKHERNHYKHEVVSDEKEENGDESNEKILRAHEHKEHYKDLVEYKEHDKVHEHDNDSKESKSTEKVEHHDHKHDIHQVTSESSEDLEKHKNPKENRYIFHDEQHKNHEKEIVSSSNDKDGEEKKGKQNSSEKSQSKSSEEIKIDTHHDNTENQQKHKTERQEINISESYVYKQEESSENSDDISHTHDSDEKSDKNSIASVESETSEENYKHHINPHQLHNSFDKTTEHKIDSSSSEDKTIKNSHHDSDSHQHFRIFSSEEKFEDISEKTRHSDESSSSEDISDNSEPKYENNLNKDEVSSKIKEEFSSNEENYAFNNIKSPDSLNDLSYKEHNINDKEYPDHLKSDTHIDNKKKNNKATDSSDESFSSEQIVITKDKFKTILYEDNNLYKSDSQDRSLDESTSSEEIKHKSRHVHHIYGKLRDIKHKNTVREYSGSKSSEEDAQKDINDDKYTQSNDKHYEDYDYENSKIEGDASLNKEPATNHDLSDNENISAYEYHIDSNSTEFSKEAIENTDNNKNKHNEVNSATHLFISKENNRDSLESKISHNKVPVVVFLNDGNIIKYKATEGEIKTVVDDIIEHDDFQTRKTKQDEPEYEGFLRTGDISKENNEFYKIKEKLIKNDDDTKESIAHYSKRDSNNEDINNTERNTKSVVNEYNIQQSAIKDKNDFHPEIITELKNIETEIVDAIANYVKRKEIVNSKHKEHNSKLYNLSFLFNRR